MTEKKRLTVFQKLNNVFGKDGIKSPTAQTNRYSVSDAELLRTTSKPEFEQAKLQNQQNKYLGQTWKKVDGQMYQQSVHYEVTRIGSYSDFENMEFYPEIAAALDIMAEECLAGSTLIPLLNGEKRTIEELFNTKAENFWVYAVDTNDDLIKPSLVESVIEKGIKKVYKLTLDDGTEIICTDNHKWLNTNNEWVSLSDLKFGDSLKSIYVKYDDKGYEKISLGDDFKHTHRIVAENQLIDKKNELLSHNTGEMVVIHHKSFNKLNNEPSELEYMFWNDHQKLHTDLNTERWKNEEFSNKMKEIFSKTAKKTWSKLTKEEKSDRMKKFVNEFQSKLTKEELTSFYGRRGENNGMYGVSRFGSKNPNYNSNKKHIEDINENDYISYICDIKGDRKSALEKKFNLTKKSIVDYNNHLCKKFNLQRIEDIVFIKNQSFSIQKLKDYVFEFNQTKSNERKRNCDITPYCKNNNIDTFQLKRFLKKRGYKNWTDFTNSIANHRVVNIEFIGEEMVYDLKNSSVGSNFGVQCNNGMIISHNCTTVNDRGRILNIYSESKRIKTILEDLFYNRLDIHTTLLMWTRNTAKYGDNFIYLNLDDKKGILGARQMPNFEMERHEGDLFDALSSRNRSTFGRDNADVTSNNSKVTFRWRGKDVEFNSWQIIHFRLLGDDRKLPYGTSILEKARRIWKQLLLSEDAMLIYRITRAPERRIFKVFVGNIDDQDVEPYVNQIANRFKRTPVVDPQTGQIDLRYNQLAQDQDYFIPVRDENSPNPIDTLPGACIALDTKIPLLDGRELELNEIIKEWDNGNRNLWVYSCDPITGKIAPGQITWAGETRKNTEVLKITLDNGESIITTPDHKWVHRTKGFVEAKDLVVGDSLMPLYRDKEFIIKKKYSKKYERVWDISKNQWVFTHRMVNEFKKEYKAEEYFTFDGDYDENKMKTIHHKDNNRFNNNPDNLTLMDSRDHYNYHRFVLWSTEEKSQLNKEKISKGLTKYINNLTKEEKKERYSKNINNPIVKDKTTKKVLDWNKNTENLASKGKLISNAKSTAEFKESFSIVAKNQWKSDEYRNKVFSKPQKIVFTDKLFKMFNEEFDKHNRADLTLNSLNNNIDFINEFNISNEGIRSSMTNLNEFTHNHLIKMIKERGFNNFREFKNSILENYNHKIVKIEWLIDKQDTGTITVDGNEKYHKYHTFATSSGVFIKNSNLSEIADIEYLQAKLFTALRVPKTFLGFSEATGDGKNLALQDVRFSRTINRIQQAMIRGLNELAILHLYMMGFDDDIDNFTLTLNNPSTQAEMLKIEHLQQKITAYVAAVVDSGNGFGAMSMTKAKRDILGMSDDEIRQDLLEQRMEKAAAAELSKTDQIIKRTGYFDSVDKIYGEIGAEYTDDEEGGTNKAPKSSGGGFGGGGFGGGGFGGGGLGGEDLDFGDEGVGNEAEDFGNEAEAIGGLEGGNTEVPEAPEVPEVPEGPATTEESKILKTNNLLTERKNILTNNYNSKKLRYKGIFFDKLINQLGGEKTPEVISTKIWDKNIKINESIQDMINGVDDILNE